MLKRPCQLCLLANGVTIVNVHLNGRRRTKRFPELHLPILWSSTAIVHRRQPWTILVVVDDDNSQKACGCSRAYILDNDVRGAQEVHTTQRKGHATRLSSLGDMCVRLPAPHQFLCGFMRTSPFWTRNGLCHYLYPKRVLMCRHKKEARLTETYAV